MKKFIVVCCLLKAGLNVNGNFSLPDTLFLSADTVYIEEIVVSTHRAPAIYSGLSRSVTVLREDEIKMLPAQSLQGVLGHVQGVDVRQRGPHGVQADVSVRGGSFEQVAVLLNGMRINDPQTGHHHLNIPAAFQDIERIEILKGPGSRIYGPNAYSGAINIITRGFDEPMVSGSFSGGEYGYFNTSAAFQFQTGSLGHRISGSYGSSDGYTDNTDFNSSNLFYTAGFNKGNTSFDLQAGYNEKSFGANSFYSALYPDQYEEVKSTFTGLNIKGGGDRLRFSQSLYWRRHYDRFELFRYEAPDWYGGHNFHMTDVVSLDAGLSIPRAKSITAMGAEVRTEQIFSNVLGEKLDEPVPVKGENEIFYEYFKRRNSVNLFAGHTAYIDNFVFSGGVMANRTSGLSWKFFGGVDVSYAFTPGWRIFSSLNSSMRAPSFTEMYYESPVHSANPSLKPEESLTAETGLKYSSGGIYANITGFRRYGKNIIDWARLDETLTWESKNVTQLDTWGAELSFAWRNFSDPESFFRSADVSYAYLSVTRQSDEYISAYILDHLIHKVATGISHRMPGNIDVSWHLRYEERAGTYTDFPSGDEKPYKPFWITDVKANYSTGNLTIFIEASNIFNTKFSDIGNIPQPGRWLISGLSVRFM